MIRASLKAVILAGALGAAAWGVQKVEIDEAQAQTTESFVVFDFGNSTGACVSDADLKRAVLTHDDGADDIYVTSATYGSASSCGSVSYTSKVIDLWGGVAIPDHSSSSDKPLHGQFGVIGWNPSTDGKILEGTSIDNNGSCTFSDCAGNSTSSTHCYADTNWSGADGHGYRIRFAASGGAPFCGYTVTL